METEFKNKWKLWYHHEKDNWKLSGFRNIYTINNIKDFWKLYNNWDKLGGLSSKHFFLMKNDIPPIWEDKQNINGGCWSYKINTNQVNDMWEYLSLYLVTENINKNPDEINGISVCLKKKNFSVIKIWNNNNKNNNLTLLNENLLKKWGIEIIYIAHITE